jgi:hypothetical protein
MPCKTMSLNIYYFCHFLSITNSAWISRVDISSFYVNHIRTDWDIGNSLKTYQNKKFPFAPLVLPIAVKKLSDVNPSQYCTVHIRELLAVKVLLSATCSMNLTLSSVSNLESRKWNPVVPWLFREAQAKFLLASSSPAPWGATQKNEHLRWTVTPYEHLIEIVQ